MRPHDIGLHENARVFYAYIHVAFSGEMNHSRWRMFREYLLKRIAIADVNLVKTIVRRFRNRDVFKVACVGKTIDVDEQCFRTAGNECVEVIATDESRTACYQNALVMLFHSVYDACPACIRTLREGSQRFRCQTTAS